MQYAGVDGGSFIMEEKDLAFPHEILQGKLGPLPLLLSINIGHLEDTTDCFMENYHTDKMLFLYKEDHQTRVLLHGSCGHSLSLPISSRITFRVSSGADGTDQCLTLSEIVNAPSLSLPISAQFARARDMEFTMNGKTYQHTYFGSLTLVAVYKESFVWCLPLSADGTFEDKKPVVLPKNLKGVSFTPISGVTGLKDSAAALQEAKDRLLRQAIQLNFQGDPFFQELAIVSKGPGLVPRVEEPYMDIGTFVTISYSRKPHHPKPPRPLPVPGDNTAGATPAVEDHGYHHDDNCYYDSGDYYSCLETDAHDGDHLYSALRDTNIIPITSSAQRFPGESHQIKPPPPSRGKSPTSDVKTPMMSPTLLPRHPIGVKTNLDGLTVMDVSKKLAELGLGKHAKKFRKNLIDGVLLQKLDEGTLKSEFNLNHLEFILLNTFITEGHIPMQRKP